MIIPMGELLRRAKKEGYGVAAPNVFNDKTIEAAFQVADELKAPIILDGAGCHGIEEIGYIARFYEKKYPNVVAALNLDHGGPFGRGYAGYSQWFSSML